MSLWRTPPQMVPRPCLCDGAGRICEFHCETSVTSHQYSVLSVGHHCNIPRGLERRQRSCSNDRTSRLPHGLRMSPPIYQRTPQRLLGACRRARQHPNRANGKQMEGMIGEPELSVCNVERRVRHSSLNQVRLGLRAWMALVDGEASMDLPS